VTEPPAAASSPSAARLHIVVIPCYNEAARLDRSAFATLADRPGIGVIAVDDGSTDATAQLLDEIAQRLPGMEVLSLTSNAGKGEAVRRGLLQAIEGGASTVGYLDADFATPVEEYLRVAGHLAADPDLDAVLAARVALLGWSIQRHPARHYLGRVFASAASVVLHLRVYDTQCGAKAFRVTPQLLDSLGEPFLSPWIFDVELLARLVERCGLTGRPARLLEVPLRSWTDVAGSKLGPGRMAGASFDLMRLAWRLRWTRRAARAAPPGAGSADTQA